MSEKNLPTFISTDFGKHPIVKYHKIFNGKMGFMKCTVLDVYGRKHPIGVVQYAQCEVSGHPSHCAY